MDVCQVAEVILHHFSKAKNPFDKVRKNLGLVLLNSLQLRPDCKSLPLPKSITLFGIVSVKKYLYTVL
jgi:hypothetical protein